MSSTRQALAGVHVLELGSGIVGPYGGRLLGDFGAEVVKLEKPDTGDSTRSDPFLFEYLNWGKKSVELELTDAGLRGWVEWADIILVSLRPSSVERLGIGPDQLHQWNPRAVVTLVSNFGHTGPYRDWHGSDLVFQALGGVLQISGTNDREPLKPGLNQSLYCAGINVAYASVAGLIDARRRGTGPVIDLSIHETVASELVMNQPYYAFLGAIQGRRPSNQDPLSGEAIPTADGFVSLQATTLAPVARFSEVFEDDRFGLPEYATEGGRTRHATAFASLLDEHLGRARARDVFEQVCGRGLLAGFVQSPEQLLTCPQLAARGFWWNHPRLAVRFPWKSVELSGTPLAEPQPAPALGEHTGDAPQRTVPDPDVLAWPRTKGSDGPLAGLRVIDLSTVFAVPYLGALLSDLGADVVKVEPPARLDQTRSSFGASFDNEPRDEYWNRASTFQVLNRGKRSVVLDLHTGKGRELFLELVAGADVLLDNFTPRVMRKWGTTYEELGKLNPRLVMLSNTGYGSTGPWSSFKAQGTTLEATMGLTAITGYAGGGPMKAGQSYPDFLACWTGLLAVLAALVSRSQTGRGQWIDLGMYQLGATVIPEAVLSYQTSGFAPVRSGNADVGAVISGLFATKEPERLVAVSVASWEQLLALEHVAPEVAQLAAVSNLVESESAALARLMLSEWLRGQRTGEAVSQLQTAGIAAGLVADARDLLEDEQLRHRGFYEWLDYPELGRRPLIGRPYRWLADSRVGIAFRAPLFAEHNAEILQPLAAAGYEELVRSGVTAATPVNAPPARPLPLDDMARVGAVRLDPEYRRRLEQFGCG
jgi:crotonobetainyl-CoA:carnitine CoA-transferase CaiB-like acyl-CoA transferase